MLLNFTNCCERKKFQRIAWCEQFWKPPRWFNAKYSFRTKKFWGNWKSHQFSNKRLPFLTRWFELITEVTPTYSSQVVYFCTIERMRPILGGIHSNKTRQKNVYSHYIRFNIDSFHDHNSFIRILQYSDEFIVIYVSSASCLILYLILYKFN